MFSAAVSIWNVLEGEIGRELLELGKSQKLKGLCYYDAGSRSFYTRTGAVNAPQDLKGLKIRVQNSRTSIQMIDSMGGAATPIAFGELYSALDQGVVDGAENNPPSFLSSRHYEVCPYYSLDEHTMVPDVILIGTESWERLSDEQQQWLKESVDASVPFQRALWATKTKETMATLKDAGVEIIEPDKAPFQQAVAALHDGFKETEAGYWMQRVLQHP